MSTDTLDQGAIDFEVASHHVVGLQNPPPEIDGNLPPELGGGRWRSVLWGCRETGPVRRRRETARLGGRSAEIPPTKSHRRRAVFFHETEQ